MFATLERENHYRLVSINPRYGGIEVIELDLSYKTVKLSTIGTAVSFEFWNFPSQYR